MARQLTITPDVADILARAEVSGNALYLPTGLDRATYLAVNKVIEAMGGGWNKQQRAHLFSRTAATVLTEALDQGAVTPLSKNGYFPTPPALVARLLELAGIEPHHTVLEPSAGQGAIADEIVKIVGHERLFLVEIQSENLTVLAEKGYAYPKLAPGDFMRTMFVPSGFDRIVMNPPFERQQDIDHVERAAGMLKPGGRLVSVMAAGVTFREDNKTRQFRALFDAFDGYLEHNPPGSFRESGTDVNTVTVVLYRPESDA